MRRAYSSVPLRPWVVPIDAGVITVRVHSHDASSSDLKNYTLLFPKSIPIYDGVFDRYLPVKTSLHIGDDPLLLEWFSKAASANYDKTLPYSKGIVQGYIALILGNLLPKLSLRELETDTASIERKLLEYCTLHYNESITLASVAEALGYSTTYISHLFSEKFKIGFSKFISTMRTEEAKKQLRTKKKVTDISLECGFGSIRNFNKVFKEYTGLSPSEFRKKSTP